MSTRDKYCTYLKRLSHQSSDIHLLISHSKYKGLFLLENQLMTSPSSFVLLCIDANIFYYNSKMYIYIINKVYQAPGRVNLTGTISIH